jgi:hypothetical protein
MMVVGLQGKAGVASGLRQYHAMFLHVTRPFQHLMFYIIEKRIVIE